MAEPGSPWQQHDLLGLLGLVESTPAPGPDGSARGSEPPGPISALEDRGSHDPLVPQGDGALASATAGAGAPADGQEMETTTEPAGEAVREEALREEAVREEALWETSALPAVQPENDAGLQPGSVALPTTSATAPAIALPPLAASPRRTASPSPSPAPAGPFPQRILILDTETTALSPDQGQCIEVGAVLFHVPSRQLLQQISFLLPCPANGAEAINGIPAAVSRLPQPLEPALACFAALVEAADALVAHNASFDRQWFGRDPLPPLSLPWICSMEDIRWPAERQLRGNPSVRDLALAYGVPVWAAHRALTDCQYLVHVFERCAELETLLAQALEPRHLYRARLSYAERHRAREAGFRWNEPVAGAWSRRLSQREVEALPFAVVPVEAADPRGDFLPRSA